MEKWEYLTIDLDKKPKEGFFGVESWCAEYFTEKLDAYGEDGWELVSMFAPVESAMQGATETKHVFATFKRKLIK